MTHGTRTNFDRQLDELQAEVQRIGGLVGAQLPNAMEALRLNDAEKAATIIKMDKQINRLRYYVEEQAYTLLALQQPNSRDMRRIVTMVSVVTNLERMGDHAVGIAKLTIRMADDHVTAFHMDSFDRMTALCIEGLTGVMQALAAQDVEAAKLALTIDDQVDDLYDQTYAELLAKMKADNSVIEAATMLMWVAHNLERFADRLTNIYKRIAYISTGELKQSRQSLNPNQN